MKKRWQKELEDAFEQYRSVLQSYIAGSDSFSGIEIAKGRIADVMLKRAGIPTSPSIQPEPVLQSRTSERASEYEKYLRSNHWRTLRGKALERDGYKCCQCGSTFPLHVHHKRYRPKLTDCVMDDVLTLCGPCHEKEHQKLRQESRKHRVPRGRRHLVDLILDYSASP